MIDVVYILGNDSRWANTELRFSLRSVQKYLSGYRQVFVVGSCPSFLGNVIHLPMPDMFRYNKEANIAAKLLEACKCDFLSARFVFMNDDHFFLGMQEAEAIENAHKGEIVADSKNAIYNSTLMNTKQALLSAKLPTKNFDVHLPMLMDKYWVKKALSSFNWAVDSFTSGMLVKSMFANYSGLEGVEVADLKLEGPLSKDQIASLIKDRWAFSIGDDITREIKFMLFQLYPNRSIYERTDL